MSKFDECILKLEKEFLEIEGIDDTHIAGIKTKIKKELADPKNLGMSEFDVLNNMVLLQRAINEKPDYQKLKPYII